MEETTQTDGYDLFFKYIAAVADFKVKRANANLTYAKAALERAKARHERAKAARIMVDVRRINTVLKQLRLDLAKFRKGEKAISKKIERAKTEAKDVRKLLLGRPFKNPAVYRAWLYLDKFLIEIDDGSVLKKIKIKASARKSSSFVHDKVGVKKPIQSAPRDIKHVLAYMEWMRDEKYLAANGYDGQEVIRQVLAAIRDVSQARVKEYRESLKQLKDGVYGTWQLPRLLGVDLPDNLMNATERISSADVG